MIIAQLGIKMLLKIYYYLPYLFSMHRFLPPPPLKTSETLTVFWSFRGVEKGCIRKKLVNSLYKSSFPSTHFRSITFFYPPLKTSECSFSMPLENMKSLVTYRSIKVSFIKVAYQSIGLMSTILVDIEP